MVLEQFGETIWIIQRGVQPEKDHQFKWYECMGLVEPGQSLSLIIHLA